MLDLLGYWYIKAPLIIIISGLTVRGLYGLSYRVKASADGWRRISAGPSNWLGLTLCSTLFFIFSYIRFFVGSSRIDAEQQMLVLTILIAVMVAGAFLCGRGILRMRSLDLRWRGTSLAFQQKGGPRVLRDFGEIISIDHLGNTLWLGFNDGEVIKLDDHAGGVGELIAAIVDYDDRFESEV